MLHTLQNQNNVNRQVHRSRTWMLDALLLLLDEMPYDKITISDIAEKAGVARQTFYRNYTGKDDVILQYLDSVFSNSLQMKNVRDENNRNILLITLSLKRLTEEKQKTTKLLRNDTERIIFTYTQKWEDYVIDFGKNKVSRMERLIFRYMVKFQVGGSLRMIMDWMKHDMPLPTEKMGELLRQFIGAFSTDISDIPSLVMMIQDD